MRLHGSQGGSFGSTPCGASGPGSMPSTRLKVVVVVSARLVEQVRGRAASSIDALGCVQASVAISEELRAEADDLVGYFVDEARRAGYSWTEIGTSLGVTKQAVRKRFGSSVGFPVQSRLQRCLDQAAEEAKLDGSTECRVFICYSVCFAKELPRWRWSISV